TLLVKIILRADVSNVGKKGDVVEVSEGYARNYLVAKGLGLKATAGAVAQAASMRRSRDLKDARDRESAERLAQALVPVVIRIPAKAGNEGRLFGSVTAADVVSAVRAQTGAELDRRRMHMDEPIKTLGLHEVPVRLHSDVEFRVTVEVVPQ
ncbi:MAG: large subunit ribosomal protein, partial [Actinomycetota bacterium]|nr:large subunit ribosomal protein [Actinomycetota bacterium]